MSYTLKFPPTSVQSNYEELICQQCDILCTESTEKIFKCANCGSMALKSSLKQKSVIKLVFKEGVNIKVAATLYSQQIEEYFCQQEMDLPSDDDDEFILQFLTDNSTTIVVDS